MRRRDESRRASGERRRGEDVQAAVVAHGVGPEQLGLAQRRLVADEIGERLLGSRLRWRRHPPNWRSRSTRTTRSGRRAAAAMAMLVAIGRRPDAALGAVDGDDAAAPGAWSRRPAETIGARPVERWNRSSRASTRASSSRASNGWAMTSSAPASRKRIRSSTSSVWLTHRTGIAAIAGVAPDLAADLDRRLRRPVTISMMTSWWSRRLGERVVGSSSSTVTVYPAPAEDRRRWPRAGAASDSSSRMVLAGTGASGVWSDAGRRVVRARPRGYNGGRSRADPLGRACTEARARLAVLSFPLRAGTAGQRGIPIGRSRCAHAPLRTHARPPPGRARTTRARPSSTAPPAGSSPPAARSSRSPRGAAAAWPTRSTATARARTTSSSSRPVRGDRRARAQPPDHRRGPAPPRHPRRAPGQGGRSATARRHRRRRRATCRRATTRRTTTPRASSSTSPRAKRLRPPSTDGRTSAWRSARS